MTPTSVTAELLHDLVAGSHAENTTSLAVAAVIQHDRHILLATTGSSHAAACWTLPGDLVLPGETLTDTLHRTVATAGLGLDRITAYLGHHDHPASAAVTRVFGFAVTTVDLADTGQDALAGYRWVSDEHLPDQLSEPAHRFLGHLWAPADVLDGYGLQPLPASLRAHATGIYALEAAVDLLIAHHRWLDRDHFTRRFVELGCGLGGEAVLAVVDWQAAVTALDAGRLACSGSEGQVLRIAASLAEGIPVDLRESLTGLDAANIGLVAQAVLHTGGQHGRC